MSLGHNDPRLANATTGIYLTRTFNIEPRETNRFMPGVNKTKTYSERLRMGIDCDEVYPGIIIGKPCSIENLKHNEMLDPLGQAWQNGSASAA